MRMGATKRAVRMPARSMKRHAIPIRTHRINDQTIAVTAVHCDEAVNLDALVTEQVPNSSKIAQALFAHGADEQNVVARLYAVFLHYLNKTQHGDETSSVVAYSRGEIAITFPTDFDLCFGGEDGVDVCNERDSLCSVHSWATSNHIAHFVDVGIGQAGGFQAGVQ